MAKSYRRVDRDQGFLLPPDLRDWLPPDDPVWLVIEIVERHVDTSAFHALRRTGAAGRAGFDPDMVLTLLVWAWMNKVHSSRQIERLCARDVGFRVICGNDAPDHSTIARFRQDGEAAIEELFVEVLVLCGRLGLGQVGLVAVDGTKIASPASPGANRTEEGLQKAAEAERRRQQERAARRAAREAAREAARAHADQDAAEDAAFGGGHGDVMDAGVGGGGSGGRSRSERIADALADVAAEKAQAAAQEAAREQARRERAAANDGRPGPGRPAAGEVVERAEAALVSARAAMAERVARFERRGRGRHPCPEGMEASPVVREALARLAKAHEVVARSRLREAQRRRSTGRGPVRNITDPQSRPQPLHTGGWLQGYNAQAVASDDGIVLATSVSNNPADNVAFGPLVQAAQAAADRMGAGPVGMVLADAGYLSVANLTSDGPDRLIAVGRRHALEAAARGAGPPTAPATSTSVVAAMRDRLTTPDGIAAYRQRGRIIETVFGHGKHNWGFTRFTGVGLKRARADWQFHGAVHNLSKIINRARNEPGWLAI